MATERTVRRKLAALAAVLLTGALVVWLTTVQPSPGTASPSAPALVKPASAAGRLAGPALAQGTDRAVDPATSRVQLIDAVALADHTYCSYRHTSQYPHGSRPISEHPDQIWPATPIVESHALRKDGGGSDPEVQIETTQSRVYLAAGESVVLTVRALDRDKQVLPLVVTSALAQGIAAAGQRPAPRVALGFADDGTGADSQAGDGQLSAQLDPAQTALALFHGTIRVNARYSVAGKSGTVLFDVLYSPQAPAIWSGQVREAMEDGSLNFYLKLDVREAGRYVVTGRVDDARGTPLALLTFNDLLAPGPAEVKLGLFGKLARDHVPVMPVTLRDVDAYLLRENTDPDRAVLARLAGKVHTSRTYRLKQFDDAPWDSPERARYLDELGRGMNRARAALAAFDPALVLEPPCKAAEQRRN